MVTMSSQQGALPRPVRAVRTGNKVAELVWVAAALALAAALAGLLLDGVYTGAGSTAQILRGYDVATAVLVVPGLSVAAGYLRAGSLLGRLVSAGLLADLVYSYAFYVFGTPFNDLFLLHLGVFSASLTALVLTVAGADLDAVATRFHAPTRAWPAAATLALLALSLGAMWISAAIVNAVNQRIPAGSRLVETTEVVHLGMALDVAVQVPLYAAAAVLLWRRSAWGYVLAFVALLSGIPEQVSYLVAMPLQVMAGVPGAVAFDPLEPVILAVYALGLVMLLVDTRAGAHRGRRREIDHGHH
jgi:hypothetical protein